MTQFYQNTHEGRLAVDSSSPETHALQKRHQLGVHLILDAWQAPPEALDDKAAIENILREATKVAGATLINVCVHQFSPHGVTATATLAESHMTIHTWPEHGYFGMDVFFCGEGSPRAALEFACQKLQAKKFEIHEIKRGFHSSLR